MDRKIDPPFLRTPYNYDRNKASDDSGLKCLDKSLAQQQFLEESDINTLVERFHLTGEMPQVQQLPQQGDYEGIFDFQTAMNVLVDAQRNFMTYPAKIRNYFENDPQKFHDFCVDPANDAELIRLGLATPPKPPPGETALAASERAAEAKMDYGKPDKGAKSPKPPKTDNPE